jgi:hypothetical protein
VARDLIQEIIEKESEFAGEIRYLHVYSHQETAIKHKDERRQEKIQQQKDLYNDEEFYNTIKYGNEHADLIADIGREEKDIERDWAHSPAKYTDNFYLSTADGSWIDQTIHKWIKNDTQVTTRERVEEDSAKRASHITPDKLYDTKLSFASEQRSKPKEHKTYTFMFKLRAHALKTREKLNRYGGWLRKTSPFKKYYQKAFPNDHCLVCEEKDKKAREDLNDANAPQVVLVKDDTEHFHHCPSSDSRAARADELWNKTVPKIIIGYQKTHPRRARKSAKIKMNEFPNIETESPSPSLLRPFALRELDSQDTYQARYGLGRDSAAAAGNCLPSASLPPCLKEVAEYPKDLAAKGLVPRNLIGALMELHINLDGAKACAAEITKAAHTALQVAYREHWKEIALISNQKATYKATFKTNI